MSFDYPRKLTVRACLTFAVTICIICAFVLLNRIMTPPELSQSERRYLKTMPDITFESVVSASFMDSFENHAADSFVFRDELRFIRAVTIFFPLMQTDKSGLYYDKEVGAGKFEKVREESLRQTAAKLRGVSESFSKNNVYYSFIPDKSVYASKYYPGFDIMLAKNILNEELGDLRYIDICGDLTADSFYRTDLHWNQINIDNIAERLCLNMGCAYESEQKINYAGDFYGVYTGQIALPTEKDALFYFDSNITARYLNAQTHEWQDGDIYDFKAFNQDDPYDFFLGGVQPLIVLENESSSTGNELYLFRDSFASSLAPLLASAYRKITLIDLRYISFSSAADLIDFSPDADVLFLYSSLVLNNPNSLMVVGKR